MLMLAVRLGIVIFAHGSSVPSANDAVRTVSNEVAKAGGYQLIETAFLEARPSLEDAVVQLANRGAARILVIPYFLTLGIHLQRDLPLLIQQLEQTNPTVHITVAPPLDGHPCLADIVLDRIETALQE